MKLFNRLNFYFVFCWLVWVFSANSMADDIKSHILHDAGMAELIQSRMQMAKAPSIAVSVNIAGEQRRFIYGFSDLEQQTRNTENTVYEIGSMSKSFTGLAIELLIEQGKLSLNDDIKQYLPNLTLHYKGEPVKLDISDFLYHTSGLPFNTLVELEKPKPNVSVEQQLQGVNLLFMPKTQFFYASGNYDVLGAVIEKVTGKHYREALASLITEPLGMRTTFAVNGNEQINNKATGYKLRFGSPVKLDAPIALTHVSSAYIHSTLADMEKWIRVQLNTDTPASMLHQAIKNSWQGNSNIPLVSGNRVLYGSGWFIDQNQGPYISHGGQNPNFSSCIALRPEQQVGIVALANINSNVILELCSDIDNYLRIGKYTDSVGDLIAFSDFIFTYLFFILLFCIILISLRLLYRFYRYCKKNGHLSIGYRDWLMSLLVPMVLVTVLYLIPSLLFSLDWHFILLWFPSTILAVLSAIVILTFLLTFNHRIKRIVLLKEEGCNE
ncbi:serine hydrolase [uncultured Gilliamella sp.]|uniref:serine hydrolase domain-containing protein n=1 Tax=uncultured Gilliamella sp. TaxID=1193505 RepID=UPI0025F900B7|nr:serine hydrolase domain-containing protein [uncultured Gilliamella sp.]